jgi:hypothetical protein
MEQGQDFEQRQLVDKVLTLCKIVSGYVTGYVTAYLVV